MENKTWTWTDVDGYTVAIKSDYRIRTSNVHAFRSWSPKEDGLRGMPLIGPVTNRIYLAFLANGGASPDDFRETCGTLIRLTAVSFVEATAAEFRTNEAEMAAKLARNVPGLDILRKAAEQQVGYSGYVEARVKRYDEVARRYPNAAAYLKAEAWKDSYNDVKGSEGKKAMDRIAAGESSDTVIAEMNAAWRRYAHMLPPSKCGRETIPLARQLSDSYSIGLNQLRSP